MIAICAANFNTERTQLSGRNSPQIACGHQSLHVIMLLCGDVIGIPSPQDLSGTMRTIISKLAQGISRLFFVFHMQISHVFLKS